MFVDFVINIYLNKECYLKRFFLMNVSFSSNGKTFLGSDARSGCHFSLAVFNSANNVLVYGDSLG